jgi:branched-chain amino acid transport system ATP-binding protein
MSEILTAEDLHVSYGPIRAVRGISISIRRGETIAVVGANGAGKTTLLRALANELPHTKGSIAYLGAPTRGLAPYSLAKRGLLHIPEGRGILATMSVDENLRLAFDRNPRSAGKPFSEIVGNVFERFPRLHERQTQLAGSLSGGEQQMLAMARAIVSPPELLLVDEPSLGLSPLMIGEVFSLLAAFKKAGMTILVVEQNALAALKLSDRAYVLRQGEIVAQGEAAKLLADTDMIRHYLGS